MEREREREREYNVRKEGGEGKAFNERKREREVVWGDLCFVVFCICVLVCLCVFVCVCVRICSGPIKKCGHTSNT